MGVPESAVDAIGGNHNIPAIPGSELGLAFMLVMDADPEIAGAGCQDFQQSLATDADESMAGRANARSMNMDVNIVPMGEFVG